MNTLNLKLKGSENLGDALVYVDGEAVKFRRNEFKNLSATVKTDKDRVKIEVVKALDVGGIFWFLTQILFFIISIFGIFDVRIKKRYMSIRYECDVDLTENGSFALKCNTPRENAAAFEIETDLNTTEISNICFADEKAKRTCKMLLIAKIFTAIAIAVIAVALLIVKL